MNTPHSRHIIQIVCACIWCLLASGIIFGFAALKPVLIQEGVYADLCPSEYSKNHDEPCQDQDMKLNSMFTISSALTNMMALPVGYILDRKGPRICGLIGSFTLFTGCLMFTNASILKFYIDPYLLGYMALAIAGPFVFISCFQLANCFPKRSGSILAILTGSFDSSSALFLMYRLVYKTSQNKFSLSRFFKLYMIVPCFILICQITIMPRSSYKTLGTVAKLGVEELDENGNEINDETVTEVGQVTPDNYTEVFNEDQPLLERRKSNLEIVAESRLKESTGGIFGVLHENTALEQIKSPWFYLMVLFAAIIMVRINYFIATIRAQEEYLLDDKQRSVTLNHIFDILLPIGGVGAVPFIGLILDNTTTINVIKLLVYISALVGLSGVITHSFIINLSGIMLFAVYRPFYYTVVSDYCSKVFGFTTFGTVYGLLTCLCGVFSISQNLLDQWTHEIFNMDPRPVNLMLVTMTIIFGWALKKYMQDQLKQRTTEASATETDEQVLLDNN
ncbi:similar to Saccharomyces cerevisiae YMR221C Putative protein of unknown function [Maudiozyma barnettii]|uniref:Protein FMP42 n=1 Tax=Maudiozyma barnettii TaxID=61262 RepID=A0A8H2VCB4_9SACH|nr:Fmp42p [Kazachstania barnettii]CAB4252682.1 similar to Saccharomyces cerevisiae YMR221C Putative protein of unknown function [Kazachstania barnettii]CAD1780472.1 similar to Saccharomyces cerevisiae YMR221C Putative protein of unknown function [Kazachstania barnettii]